MPLLSIIVPVYNVEPVLRQCLDSILAEATDAEVIAVDDASTDASGEILREYEPDPRVVVVRLDHNRGLGPARNAGLDVATGEYLMFVDSDDWLAEGALPAITQRIRTADADVVVFDFSRAHADRSVVRNDKAYLLSNHQEVFGLDDHPAIVNLLQVVWNKAYRRAFVEKLGLRFFPGYYEDIPWTGPVLMSARSIATLDRVCYVYRIGRPGSIVQTTSQRHFDALQQYERLFAFIDQHPETERFRGLMHARMTRHLLAILRRGRVPADARRRFFAAVVQLYRTHRPPQPAIHPLWDLALQREWYWLYAAGEAVRSLRSGVASLSPKRRSPAPRPKTPSPR